MKEIIQKCKYGIFFTANEHRDYYQSAEEWLLEQIRNQSEVDEIGKDIWNEMIKRDTVYYLQFYPRTPISFFKIYHYDYDEIIKQAKDILKGKGKG